VGTASSGSESAAADESAAVGEVEPGKTKGPTVPTRMEIETAVRVGLAGVIESDVGPADVDPDLDMSDAYGLTSLNKVIFLMSVCDDTQVSLSSFTEADVAAMRTLRDVVTALVAYAGTGV
jgi:hypothetical protein